MLYLTRFYQKSCKHVMRQRFARLPENMKMTSRTEENSSFQPFLGCFDLRFGRIASPLSGKLVLFSGRIVLTPSSLSPSLLSVLSYFVSKSQKSALMKMYYYLAIVSNATACAVRLQTASKKPCDAFAQAAIDLCNRGFMVTSMSELTSEQYFATNVAPTAYSVTLRPV